MLLSWKIFFYLRKFRGIRRCIDDIKSIKLSILNWFDLWSEALSLIIRHFAIFIELFFYKFFESCQKLNKHETIYSSCSTNSECFFSNEVMDVITLAELLYQIFIIFEFISFCNHECVILESLSKKSSHRFWSTLHNLIKFELV